MSANVVTVSDDGREALVTNPDRPGWKMQVRSARPEGFQPEDLWNAQAWEPLPSMMAGQRTVTHRKKVGAFVLYVHWLSGPPTWPLPLVKVTGGDRKSIMVGWLQRAVAISVRKEDGDEAVGG